MVAAYLAELGVGAELTVLASLAKGLRDSRLAILRSPSTASSFGLRMLAA